MDLDAWKEHTEAKLLRLDRRMLALAQHISAWSKDPSTKVGCVIRKPDRSIALGVNGFPTGVADTPERWNDRDTKYKLVVHSEPNAIMNGGDVRGGTLYTWPFSPCIRCAGIIIQAGIQRVVAPPCPPDKLERWGPDLKEAINLLREAGVQYAELDIG